MRDTIRKMIHDNRSSIRSVLWITEKLHPLQSALEALKRDTDLQKSWPVK
jgi:hypothetical protein